MGDEGVLEYTPPPAEGLPFPKLGGYKDLVDAWVKLITQEGPPEIKNKEWPPKYIEKGPPENQNWKYPPNYWKPPKNVENGQPNKIEKVPPPNVVQTGPEVVKRGMDEAGTAKSEPGKSFKDFLKELFDAVNKLNQQRGPPDLTTTLDKWKKDVLELRAFILAKEDALVVYKALGDQLTDKKKKAEKLAKKIKKWEEKYKGKNTQKVGEYQKLLLEFKNCKTDMVILELQLSITLQWIKDLVELIKCKSQEINKVPAKAEGGAWQIDASAVEEAAKLVKQAEEGMAAQEEMLKAGTERAEQVAVELADMEQQLTAGVGTAEQQKPEQE
ncbi:hypothetical protein AAL_02064 [Moelleriella libera RCEF 2490]|uniref:Uncharacterized protein n=1 Tax=Moelleriella libera RCEF 2490 TaxID=1081109 RepID=A0A162IWP7_9HYPO|nr:hypothetical protein AAL_02064 [Moelleriella libera RCEF 2490]